MCSPVPQESLAMFRERCEIFIPNDLVLETTIFNRGRCSNVLCSTVEGECSNDGRCCCQDFTVSQVNYSCPNMTLSSGVVGMVEQCVCQLCTNVSVVFVGRVTDHRDIPVIVANITVNGVKNYITDELGFFAFSVSAQQESVSIWVSAVGYLTSGRTYSVLPGGMRTIQIVLKALLAVTMRPPEGDFYQSVTTLQVLSNIDEEALSSGESSIRFPSGFFADDMDYTFVAVPINPTSDADILSLRLSFLITVTTSEQQRSESSFRNQGRKTVRQIGSSRDIVLSVTNVGVMSIMDELGMSIRPSSEFVIRSYFDSRFYSRERLSQLRLYVLNQTSQEYYLAVRTAKIVNLRNGRWLVEFTVRNGGFPLNYIVAFEESTTCYAAVRAYDSTTSSNASEIMASVRAITKQEDNSTTIAYATTPNCLPVPCTGNLTIRVAEDEGVYVPEQISLSLSIRMQEEGAVYFSLRACEAIGLTSTNPSDYLNFTLNISSLVPLPPLPIGLENPPFCTLKVEATATDNTTIEVVAILESGMMVMERITTTAGGSSRIQQQGAGSGFIESLAETACLWIPCDPQLVTVIATVVGTSERCLPMPGRAATSNADVDLLQNLAAPPSFDFTFQVPANSSVVAGVHRSEQWPELAYNKCLTHNDIGVTFQCISS